jgi:hypothetical protein
VLWTALLLGACGSNADKKTPGGDASSADTGPILDDLFTSPDVPRCENTFTAQYQLKGSIEGQEVSDGNSFISFLDSTSLSFGAVRLTWADPLAEDTAIPLIGTSLAVPTGHPLEGHGLCITQGKFGSPSLHDGDPGRQFLFEVTGTKLDDCSGRDVPIHVHGCLIRTNTYFPIPARNDAGSADEPAASDAHDSWTVEEVPGKADGARDLSGDIADLPVDRPGADGPVDSPGGYAGDALDGSGFDAETPSTLNSGLVSWWRCDGNASDSKGSNNGTLQGGMAFVEGRQGQACQFNGADAIVTVNNSSTLAVDRGFTLAFWIRIQNPPPAALVVLRKYVGSYEDKFIMLMPDGRLNYYLFNLMNATPLYTQGPLVVDTWQHIAGVYDGTKVKIYVNGIFDGSMPASGSISNSTGQLTFGQSADYPYFAGALDEIRWYSRSLTDVEIAALAAGGT